MFSISKDGIIQLTRGDSFIMPLFINSGCALIPERYALLVNDKIYFGLMECNQPFEDAIVKKVYDYDSPVDENGDLLIELSPQDTEHLLVGKYYYSIKLVTNIDGKEVVATIVPNSLFYIVE